MKKEVVVKRITTYHNSILDTTQKLRDFIYTLDDPELCEIVDEWCESVEEFFEEDGSVTPIIEALDDVFIDENLE